MPTDLTVVLSDHPGELARLGRVLGDAGVNIKGLAAFTGEGRGFIHLLVDDDAVDRCRDAFDGEKIGLADERPVLVVDIEDKPGSLGELTRRLAAANVNVDLAYTTFGGVKLVIATDDMDNAEEALAD
jgi:hypothetical protein